MNLTIEKRPDYLSAYCDGATGGDQQGAGLGVIIRNEQNEIVGLVKRSMPAMNNIEAEYAALILALETIQPFKPRYLQIYLDCKVVVGQMQGRYAVNSAHLKHWHKQACRLACRYQTVTYHHIPREANRLADALANEALLDKVK